jgi:VIT1/CCC1 family predicted Fe2+/Mn2+ transporter
MTTQLTTERPSLEEASTADLVRDALDEAKELLSTEIEIAKSEVEQEIAQAKKAAIGIGIALTAGVIVLSLLAVALVLALGATATVALAVAALAFVVGATAALAGYAVMPRKPLLHTRDSLKSDTLELKEHLG